MHPTAQQQQTHPCSKKKAHLYSNRNYYITTLLQLISTHPDIPPSLHNNIISSNPMPTDHSRIRNLNLHTGNLHRYLLLSVLYAYFIFLFTLQLHVHIINLHKFVVYEFRYCTSAIYYGIVQCTTVLYLGTVSRYCTTALYQSTCILPWYVTSVLCHGIVLQNFVAF